MQELNHSTKMKALLTTADKTASLNPNHPTPTLPPDSDRILVRTIAIALNPTDWKSVTRGTAPPDHIVGCDYAGIVEQVGSLLTKPFAPGDRIAGFTHGCNALNPQDGAFAEYITPIGDLQIKIPENLSFEEAATLGVGITTVGQGLYQSLQLPEPASDAELLPQEDIPPPTDGSRTILIYGGSTATGTLAIQYAKLSGYHVLTTCSPRNFDLVRGYGADAVFDYGDSNAPAAIKEYTGDNLRLVFDTISLSESAEFSDKVISPSGGVYSALLKVESQRSDVISKYTLGYTAFGEEKQFGTVRFEASKEDREFAERFWELSRGLLERGVVRTHPVSVRPGGLQGAVEGLEAMRKGEVSGEKLVYRVEETP
ncbi:putative zinc-binding oxidoreductase ToxD [Aspergillus karnatakaensis]|uniref:zinc-binding alcohol dehydrogenase family protein n=1 Tax=Aspergillus karnatakaensis TaxID=1810916 RepID=UPI003CCDAD6F